METPRVLIYSANESARKRLTESIARALDLTPLECASVDEVRTHLATAPADAIVIEHSPADPSVHLISPLIESTDIDGGIFHLADTPNPSPKKGELWLPRDVRGHVLADALSRHFATRVAKPRKTHEQLEAFRITLDDLEKALDNAHSSIDLVRSLRDTHELLEALNLGPPTLEMSLVSTEDEAPSEDGVRAFITQLRALIDDHDPAQGRVMLCGRDSRLTALKPLLEPHVTVTQVLHRDSLEPACELLVPHVVVIVDENDQDTRETLLLLRRILPGLSPSIALLGRARRPLDRHVSYDVALAFDADLPIEEVAAPLIHAARHAALDAPRVLIVDENGTLQDAVDAVHRMGGHAIVVRNASQVRDVMAEVLLDATLLSPNYHHVSGFDLCRAIRAQSRVPILFIADHADQATRSEAFRSGADDLIALPWVAAEAQKRIRQLVELHRLRGTTFQVDQITGTKHVSALEHGLRELSSKVGGSSQISMAAFEVCGFAELRAKHGETSARTVLRHVADSLTSHFDSTYVYRGWGERFFVLTDKVLPEDPTASPWAPILELSRVTFRDPNGRGFYASLNVGQLIAPVGQVSVNGCIEGLLRILSRCRALGSAQMMTARVETQSNHVPERDARASNPQRQWKPVVLTREDD